MDSSRRGGTCVPCSSERERSRLSTRSTWVRRYDSRSKDDMSGHLGGGRGDELSQPIDERVEIQRLHEIVGGAGLHAASPVLRLPAPADEDDGDVPELLVLLHRLAQLETVDPG